MKRQTTSLTNRTTVTVQGWTTLFALLTWSQISLAETSYPVFDPGLHIATHRHVNENRFGNNGTVNKHPGVSTASLNLHDPGMAAPEREVAVRFNWRFTQWNDPEEFVGMFIALRRPSVETVLPGGLGGPAAELPDDFAVNLNAIEKTGCPDLARIDLIRLTLGLPPLAENFILRVELHRAGMPKGWEGCRIPINPKKGAEQQFDVPINAIAFLENPGKTIHATEIALIIEEQHFADDIRNPVEGWFDLRRVELVRLGGGAEGNVDAIVQLSSRRLAEELARREFETIWRLADAKTGFSWDRTLYPDLLHTGATGWVLAALPYAVDFGWVPPDAAEERALRILRWADRADLYHNGPDGAIGNSKGVLYRFLGFAGADEPLTGTRKTNLGNTNTSEASIIDTALFHYGVAMASVGFDKDKPKQAEIRRLPASILRRTV
ncbi:MAG: hypothetical protein ABL994_09480, partial [Verrucomicrobiales bacterium]